MSKGTVLIIDDNALNLDMARVLLDTAGFTTLVSETAEGGIRVAQDGHPDAILMDMHLPDKDGYEATRTLKSIPALKNIPVIAFTAYALREEEEKALAVGCSGFISKPIDVKQFPNQVASFIETDGSSHSQETVSQTGNGSQALPQNVITSSGENKSTARFFSRLAHDLKTPIAAEYQALQVLAAENMGPLNEKQKNLLKAIIEANRDLNGKLNDLFDQYCKQELNI